MNVSILQGRSTCWVVKSHICDNLGDPHMTLVQSSKRDRPWKRGQREAQLEVQRKRKTHSRELVGTTWSRGKHQATKIGGERLKLLKLWKMIGEWANKRINYGDVTILNGRGVEPRLNMGNLTGKWSHSTHVSQVMEINEDLKEQTWELKHDSFYYMLPRTATKTA